MDTSFWDDDEDRVQIVYQDDQLPPLQAPQELVAGAGMRVALDAVVNVAVMRTLLA